MLIALIVLDVLILILVFLLFSLVERVRVNAIAIHSEQEKLLIAALNAIVSSGNMIQALLTFIVPPQPKSDPVEETSPAAAPVDSPEIVSAEGIEFEVHKAAEPAPEPEAQS